MLEPNPTVRMIVRERAAIITLNRPDRYNAMTIPMMRRLHAAILEADASEAAGIIIEATGPGFCGGQDLRVLAQSYASEPPSTVGDLLRNEYHAVIAAIEASRLPVIAAIQGVAAGGGWSLALACDLRLAGASARFVPAFGRLGFVPDLGGTTALIRTIGYARAMQFCLLTGELSAAQAAEWGLVNEVVPDNELSARAREWVARIAGLPPEAVTLTKRALQAAAVNPPAEQRAYEAWLQRIAARAPEHAAAVAAFVRRKSGA
jgi:2-(1,2-epoxy-1,2-dihydrophenyl)acetyl-CoA isomerase